jgi:Family of unknown function (DUF5675)
LQVTSREQGQDGATYGKMYVNGTYECETLEDQVREVPGHPVKEWKISGETAIPSGTYQVLLTPSPHFGNKLMPLLVGVEDYEGVRIHPGNFVKQTEGCILVGKERQNVGDNWSVTGPVLPALVMSTVAFDGIMRQLIAASCLKERADIEVRNPCGV